VKSEATIADVLRPAPAQQAPAGQSTRSARVTRTAFLGVTYQGVYALAQMLMLGMLVRSQGAERFGLWMTVLALAALLMPLSTLGQQSALLTRLGGVALTSPPAAARMFSASCVVLGLGTATQLLLLAVSGPSLPWSHLLNASGPFTRDLAAGTALLGLVVATATFPATHGGWAVLAHQRGDLVHLVNISSTLAALGAVALAVRSGAPLWAVGALTIASTPAAGLWLWGHGIASGLVPRPRIALVDRATLRAQFAAGLNFLAIDVTTLLLLRTPELIVARMHGVEAVATFAAVARLIMLMLALFQAVLVPLWPAIAEAEASGDRSWIRRTARRSLATLLGMWAVGALGIVLLGPTFIRLWTGHAELVDRPLIAVAAVQTLAQGLVVWLGVFLAGLSLQRRLVLAMGAASPVFLALALVLGTRIGPLGVALAQAAALLLVAVPTAARALWPRFQEDRPAPKP
jgi:O-antigen/teichoic acid export membrane protein